MICVDKRKEQLKEIIIKFMPMMSAHKPLTTAVHLSLVIPRPFLSDSLISISCPLSFSLSILQRLLKALFLSVLEAGVEPHPCLLLCTA